MAERTITAEIDGKERIITADIPEGASNEDIMAAVEEYLSQPQPVPAQAPPPKPAPPAEAASRIKPQRSWQYQVMDRLAGLGQAPNIPGTNIPIPDTTGATKLISGALDVADLAATPARNIFRWALREHGKAEAKAMGDKKVKMAAPTAQEVLAPEEGAVTLGDPRLDVEADILGGLLPTSGLTPMLLGKASRLIRDLKQARKLQKAADLEAKLAEAVARAEKYTGKAAGLEIPPKPPTSQIPIGELGGRIRGDEAVIQAQQELGPQASLIPNQILRPTEPEVRGAQQLGVTSRTLPSNVLGNVGENEVMALESRIESLKSDIEVLNESLNKTRTAATRTGIRDTRTERSIQESIKAKKAQINEAKTSITNLKQAKVPKQAPQEVAPPPPPPEPTTIKGKAVAAVADIKDRTKEWFKNVAPHLQSKDQYLERKGYAGVVDPIHNSIYSKDQFVAKYADEFKKIEAEFKIDKKKGEQISRILNGETIADAAPDAKTAAEEIRRRIMNPIHDEISKDPELARLIGPVGFIKDYFPHMEATWLSKVGDADLVANMVHDLKPAGLKSRFWKTRSFDNPEFNRDLNSVLNAYIHGSAKTKFDLLAYDRANMAVNSIKDVTHKETALKYLRDYMGQPSSRLNNVQEITAPITKFYYRSLIGLNPTSAAINLTQTYLNTATRAGYKNTSRAIKHVMGNWREAQAEARAAGVLEGYPQISEGVWNSFRNDLHSKGFADIADDFLFSAFKSSEQFNRMVAYFAGKADYLARAEKGAVKGGKLGEFAYKDGVRTWIGNSKTKEASRKAGWDMARKTQFLYGRESPVGYAQIPVLGQFSNYPLKQAEFILDTILHGDAGMKARLLAQYGSAAGAVAAYAQWKDQNPWTAINTLVGDIMPIPGVGPGIVDLKDLTSYGWRVMNGKIDPRKVPLKALETIYEKAPGSRQLYRLKKSLKED